MGQRYKKIDIITLGCAKNIVDTEHMAGALKRGYKIVFDDETFAAQIVIINTCGFILDAKQESIDMILSAVEAKKQGQIERLYVVGCLSERYADELRAEIPEVDEYFGARDFSQVLGELKAVVSNERVLTTPSHYAYLKISEGCNWGCGYCAIPLIRGEHRSVPMEDLLSEARQLVLNGVRELIVIAQDTTYYGKDLYGERRLGELLRELCRIDGVEWIRLQYAYPTAFADDVMRVMAEEPKMCKYLDIPFQHIADSVLSSMRRGITKAETEALVVRLRSEVPGIALRTTMLVGYPGETEQDFEELLDFIERTRFERLGVFAYSEEQGTYSALNLKDDVSDKEKEQRVERVMNLQQTIAETINESRLGMCYRVLVDRLEGEYYIARTEYDSPEVDCEVLIRTDRSIDVGEFIDIKVTGVDGHDIYGVLL